MSWKTFVLVGTLIGLVWGLMLWYVAAGRPLNVAAPLRTFVAYQGPEGYRVEAEGFHIDGFCTVFYKGGRDFAAVCGQHTVSEAEER